ncbi:bark storage protein a [Phtheirospermum japonicum]|uniref:Bark storage protein a n=1 Tax=Phtheirospermum japonicum TaxID=374723 RepID=A0A830CI18_9LAMI|nr:bark storage protein a [Phtheirospermum japonicum]
MLDYFNIKGLIHFGISGNTNSSLSIGDVTIPKQFANTGLWDWLKPNATVPQNDVAKLDVDNYNVPKGGNNTLGRIAYSPEQFYSEAGEPNTAQQVLWFQVTNNWLQLATTLQGMQLEQCVNSSLCLETKPKVVVGLKGSTANTFLDNAAYRDFLFQTFGVSSADMESTAVVMASPLFIYFFISLSLSFSLFGCKIRRSMDIKIILKFHDVVNQCYQHQIINIDNRI